MSWNTVVEINSNQLQWEDNQLHQVRSCPAEPSAQVQALVDVQDAGRGEWWATGCHSVCFTGSNCWLCNIPKDLDESWIIMYKTHLMIFIYLGYYIFSLYLITILNSLCINEFNALLYVLGFMLLKFFYTVLQYCDNQLTTSNVVGSTVEVSQRSP